MASEVQITISAIDKTKQALGGIEKSLASLGKVALAAGAVGLAAIGAGLAYSIKEAMEAEEVMAQLEAVIKATGGVAGITAKEASTLANSLMGVTRFTDETILSAETMLLQFKGINKDVFPQTTELALDLATRMGTDASSAAQMLGKALETPGEGLMRLKAAGVAFDDTQVEIIQGMAEAGDMAGAQKLILDELSKSIGGAARASGNTFAGQLDILKNSLSNVAEGIGTALLPILQNLLTNVIIPIVPYIQAFAEGITNLIGVIADAGIASSEFNEALSAIVGQQVADVISNIIDKFIEIKNVIMEFVNTTLVPFVQKHWEEFKGALIAVGAILAAAAIVTGIIAIAGVIASLFNPITLIIGVVALLGAAWAGNWGGIQEKTQAVIDWIKPYIQAFLQTIKDWWDDHGEQVIATVKALWDGAKAAFNAAVDFIKNLVTTFLAAVKGFWDDHGEQIKTTVQAIWDAVIAIFEWFRDQFKILFDAFKAAREGDWYTFGEKLRTLWDNAWEAIKLVLTNAWEAIKTAIGNGIEAIKTKFTNTDWGAVGKSIIQGVADGITASLQIIKDAAVAAAKAAWEAAKGFLGIDSPSKVFADIGKNMMTGMAIGIAGNANIPSSAMVGATASIVNNTFNLTANYQNRDRQSLAMDIKMLAAMYG